MNRDYSDPLYKQWRVAVRKRDDSVCKWPHCKSKKKIHVHHIMKWSNYPSLRYDINNGICLCKIHHDMIKNNEDAYIQLFASLIKK
jgi:hypothetical protein